MPVTGAAECKICQTRSNSNSLKIIIGHPSVLRCHDGLALLVPRASSRAQGDADADSGVLFGIRSPAGGVGGGEGEVA